MRCYKCGVSAPPGAKYCGNCGALLEAYGPVIPDPNNHDKDYRWSIQIQDWTSIDDFFFDHYTHKLDCIDDWVWSRVDALEEKVQDPHKTLAQYQKLREAAEQKFKPFFEGMVPYYSPVVMTYYWDVIDSINQAEAGYRSRLPEHQQEYEAVKAQKNAKKAIADRIAQRFVYNRMLPQAEVLSDFTKAEQAIARQVLREMLRSGKLLRGKKDISSRGRWMLIKT
jgi:hypothetical protein